VTDLDMFAKTIAFRGISYRLFWERKHTGLLWRIDSVSTPDYVGIPDK